MREWYEPIAKQWLQAQFRTLREIRLIMDGTKISFGHQLLIVYLAYRQRAILIVWTWVKQVRGHSTAGKQLALLAYVRTLLPKGGRSIREGLRQLLDQVGRRDLSNFQIDLR